MDTYVSALPFAVGILVSMLICLELGRFVARRMFAKDPKGDTSSYGVVEAAVFGLYSLILAFTFSGAPARFDAQRQLIAQEANAISTAYLRFDLLSAELQPDLRARFRDYVDSRLEVYRRFPDIAAVEAELSKSEKLQAEIWAQSVAAMRSAGTSPEAARLLLPALNDMIDVTTTRTMASRIHPPPVIFVLLFLLSLVASLVAGYRMANSKRSWLHITAFVGSTVITIYAVLDIEYPRLGVIRIDAYDRVMADLRASMQ